VNELAAALDIRPLAGPIDCHSWIPVEIGDRGAELDFCAVCGRTGVEHDDADDADDDRPDRDGGALRGESARLRAPSPHHQRDMESKIQ
jgi:hypothetical protein